MKILVTGGAGFIASQVVDKYIELGHEVVVVDDLSSGKKEQINPKATFYEMSITDPKLNEIFEKEKPEIVNHHAAQIDVRKSVEDPIFDANINLLGMINVLECCRKNNVKRILFSSSGGAIYGSTENLPADEETPKKPDAPYGIAKYTGELYLAFYAKTYGIKYCALRYGNVYGPRQDPFGEAGVVAIFSNLLMNGKQPTIFGNGEQTRDFVFVGDVVESNVLALEKGDNQAINIGAGEETSVNRLFQELKTISRAEVDAINAPARKGEVERICLDIKKAEEILGWKPKTPLKEGLEKTYASLGSAVQ